MTQRVSLSTETVQSLVYQQLEERLKIVPRADTGFNLGTTCEVVLPVYWSDGDAASVYVGERNGCVVVHDGGQIGRVLAWAKERGLSKEDAQRVKDQIAGLEVVFESESGIAFAETRLENLLYWLLEMGRIMIMVPHLFPELSE